MSASIRLDQYIPAESVMHSLDPRTKIMLTAVLLAAAVNAKTTLQLILMVLAACLLTGMSGINLKTQFEGLKPFLPIVILTALLALILVQGEPVLKFVLISISSEGIITAFSITIRLILVLLIARIPTLTTPPLYFMEGLARILKLLTRFGFPVQETIMIMGIALRFIPVIIEEANHLARAQAARGGSNALRLGNVLSLLVPLFQVSLRRAASLSEAMESRGYTGQERSSLYKLALNRNDYLCLAALFIWLIIFITLKPWGAPL